MGALGGADLKPVGATGIGLLTAAGKRSFLDQSDARVFFITFAVFLRVDLGAIFVIVPDAKRAAASSGLDGGKSDASFPRHPRILFGSVHGVDGTVRSICSSPSVIAASQILPASPS